MRNEYDEERKTGLRVVLDTNVYISIFTRPESALFQVWTHAVRGNYELFVSPFIVSHDLDLLRLKTCEGIGIISPIDFLNTLGSKKAA